MADVQSSFKNWSTTLGSNTPTSASTIGSGLAPNLQQIQSTMRNELATRSASVTAAATTDIGAKDEGTVLVTNASGTIAITSFGTVSAGIKKLVTFTVSGGSLSITYNATSMILPSAANITVVTGDSLLAESLGSGNWKVHFYTPQLGTTPFVDTNPVVVGSSDATKKARFEVDGLTTATTRVLTVPDKDITVAGLVDFAGYIYGLNCSSAADTVHDITIATGQCLNSTNTTSMTLAGALTKQIDAAWAVGNNLGGMFTGAVAASTTYYLFLIRRSDTGVVDAGWDTSITAANKPANYDTFRLIMSLKTDGSSQIRPFEQNGNGSEREIRYFTPPLDANNVANTTTYINQALSVPSGKRFKAFGNVTRAGAVAAFIQIRPPSASDGAPSNTASPLGNAGISSAVSSSLHQWACHTDTSGQVQTATNAAGNIYMTTEGYREYL